MLATALLVVRQTKGQRLPIDLLGRFTPSVQLLFVCAHTQLRSVRINYRAIWFQRLVCLGLILDLKCQSEKCIKFSNDPMIHLAYEGTDISITVCKGSFHLRFSGIRPLRGYPPLPP